MKPNISEFSYGYALTDELIHWHGEQLTAAPVMPSLFDEGQPGGGYDVMLQRPGLPLFLQFKLAHCMIRSNSLEAQSGLLSLPYYRMHIRPWKHSNQHEMLLDLENQGQEVFYSAPAFYEPEELNDAYLRHQVKERSLWLKPSKIGALVDDDHHYVAFQLPNNFHVCSKPRRIEGAGDFNLFRETVRHAFDSRSTTKWERGTLEDLAGAMEVIGEKKEDISLERRQQTREALAEKHPLQRIAYYAHIFLDAQLFVVTEGEG